MAAPQLDITRHEFSQTDPLSTAHLSKLVALFQGDLKVRPTAPAWPEPAQYIVNTLLTRAALTPVSMLKVDSLGRYSLYVLRYCFVDQGTNYPIRERADEVLPFVSELTLGPPKYLPRHCGEHEVTTFWCSDSCDAAGICPARPAICELAS